MSKQATYIFDGQIVPYTNTDGVNAVAYGDVVPLTGMVGVAVDTIAASGIGNLCIEGVFDFPSVTNASFAVGDLIYWDDSNNVCTKTAQGNTIMGRCVLPKGSSGAVGRVKIYPS